MPNPNIQDLRHVARLLAEMPDPAAARVSSRLLLYMSEAPHNESMTLPRALGLSPAPGKSTWWEEDKNECRDAAMRTIYQQSFLHSGVTKAARDIVIELERYKKTGKPSACLLGVAKEVLDTAVDAGDIPQARRMLDILRSK